VRRKIIASDFHEKEKTLLSFGVKPTIYKRSEAQFYIESRLIERAKDLAVKPKAFRMYLETEKSSFQLL
jgi:hypothetical protein